MDAIGERCADLRDIFAGAAADGAPLVLSIEAEEAVIVPEAHERVSGEFFDLLGWAGPDGGSHGREIPAEEILAVAALFDIFGEG